MNRLQAWEPSRLALGSEHKVQSSEESGGFSSFIGSKNLVSPFTKTGNSRRRQKVVGEN